MPVKENVKHILVIYTGGTIGMKKNAKGTYVPEPNVFPDKIRGDSDINISAKQNEYMQLPKSDSGEPDILYKIKEYSPLLDSSNMRPDTWTRVAKDIGDEYEKWDAFVILHGTDTMAYTASALSFMLKGTQKPVIVTGAQIPIFEVGSDAKNNFLNALRFAANEEIREVCVVFANKLLRGNRTVKANSEAIEAFVTPNYNTLGEIGVEYAVDTRFCLTPEVKQPDFFYDLNENVVILRIFPTISNNMLKYILKAPTEGVILLSYGAGNIPDRPEFKTILREAIQRNVLIVNLTQCMRGTVRLLYETGEVLQELGVVAGCDMTVEAAFAKLTYVLGHRELSYEEKKQLMMTDICGELTQSQGTL